MILSGETQGRIYDICIVGAGAVGIAMAHRLRGAKKRDGTPLQVVVLESGVRNVSTQVAARRPSDPNVSPHDRRQSGIQLGSGERWIDPIARDLDNGTTNDFLKRARPGFLTDSRTRCFGGSTNCWGGYIRPLDESDFNGWALKRPALEPYYRDALKDLMQLDDFDLFDKPEEWVARTLADPPIAVLDQAALKEAGLRTVVIQQQNDNGVRDFQQQFAWVFTECDNITLIRNATALYLSTTYQDRSAKPPMFRATTLTCGTLLDAGTPGPKFILCAERYVLAMGGLEIPRILRHSIPGSIGLSELEERGLGRYYMNHPKYGRGADATIKSLANVFTQAHRNFYGGARQAKRPSATVYAYITPIDPGAKPGSPNNFRVAMGCDDSFTNFNFDLNFEQTPNDQSTVSLGSEPDHLGVPRLHVDWKFLRKDALTLTQSMGMIEKMIGKLGGAVDGPFDDVTWDYDKQPFPPLERDFYTGDHHMGTCRMKSDDQADDGVVDSRCQVRQFHNLWICSTGVFRTGGWANATFTLLALALRLADHLKSGPGE